MTTMQQELAHIRPGLGDLNLLTHTSGTRDSGPAFVTTGSMDVSPRCMLAIRAHEPTVLTNHKRSELVALRIFYALHVRTWTIYIYIYV